MIQDWDDAYANRDHIPGADGFITAWEEDARAFRVSMFETASAEIDIGYGDAHRNRMDIFHPETPSKGLLIFVHGGYWRSFSKATWSHFAAGPLAAGWTVAMPSYTLAPDIHIAGITNEIAMAVTTAAERISGPIRLAGHSAGGHLVTRMVCVDTRLQNSVTSRIDHVMSISGVHDLRPLLNTQMNDDFRLSEDEAVAESPALQRPMDKARVSVWVGENERPEFVRQSTLLANVWTGLGVDMAQTKEPGKHHFDVIDGLKTPDSTLVQSLLD